VLCGTSCFACNISYRACGVGGVGVEWVVMCGAVLKVEWMRVINDAVLSMGSCGRCG
jgi:hypothetical protein